MTIQLTPSLYSGETNGIRTYELRFAKYSEIASFMRSPGRDTEMY